MGRTRAQASGNGLNFDYSELPEALWTKVAPHFGLAPNAGAVALMPAVSQRHSKRRDTVFAPDRDPHRAGAVAFRPVAEPIVGPAMQALAALRPA